MAKKHRKKDLSGLLVRVFIGMMIAVVLLIIAGLILSAQPANTGYVVTEDGHVHASDGTHIGTYDELFGDSGLTVTEDGHIHDAEGNHVGDVDDVAATEEAAETGAEEEVQPAE